MTRHLLYLSLFVLVLSTLLMQPNPAAADESKGEDNTNVDSETLVDYQTINSAGPLSDIFLGADVSAQITHIDSTTNQVFPPSSIPGDYGTFLVISDTLYAPDFSDHGGSATGGLGAYTAFTQVSQSTVTGSGTLSDPFEVVTVVDVGSTGLSITQTDSYVIGQESYQTDIEVSNSGAMPQDAILYRAMDCYLGSSDSGYGLADAATGTVACTKNPNNTPSDRIEQLSPLTDGNQYYQAGYSEVWSWIGSKQPFPNTCQCDVLRDNGMGISWNATIPAGGQATFSHLTLFSPEGNLPLTTSKTADEPTSSSGETNGYTIIISNTHLVDVALNSIIDDLPTDFTVVPGSTTGATTDDPTVVDQTLTWSGPFTVTTNSSLSLSFNVTVAETPGTYFNNATAEADSYLIVATGDTAPITVTANQSPVAVDDSYTTSEDTTLTVAAPGVLNNDSDPDGDTLSASLESGTSNGTVELAGDGSFVYTPDENFNGQDGFSYIVSDGTLTDTAEVSITVTSVNDAPVAVDDSYSTNEDTPLTVTAPGVLDNDSDLDGDTLSATLENDVSNGTVELAADGSFVYTPDENFNGQDGFSYILSDGTLTDSAEVSITVTSVNDTPSVNAGTDQSADEGQEVQFEGSFTDPGLHLLGGASIEWDFGDGNSAMDTLTPTHTYLDDGAFTVSLTVTDAEGASSSDFLLVTVSNVAPVVDAGSDMTATVGIAADFSAAFSDAGTLDSHTIAWDFGDGNSASDTLTPSHSYDSEGTFIVTLTVTDDDGAVGEDELTVTVSEGMITPVTLSGFDQEVTINWWLILALLSLLGIGVSFRLRKLASQQQ